MGIKQLLKKWNKQFKQNRELDAEDFESNAWDNLEWDTKSIGHSELFDIHDSEQREQYVCNCLEQMKEATIQMQELTLEYQLVTSYLKDIEEIDALPPDQRTAIEIEAKKISQIEEERGKYRQSRNLLSQIQYEMVERLQEEIPQGYQKLKDSEEYQYKIKQDLVRLDGERHAYEYRKEELNATIYNTRGMSLICLGAIIICLVMLLLLQYTFGLDTQIGYILSSSAAAITITCLYIKYFEAKRELQRVEKSTKKLVLLQNKVKIRYVNNSQLLDYLMIKYNVTSALELKTIWEKYQEEQEGKKMFLKTGAQLEEASTRLIGLLKRNRVQDASIWLHQAQALLDRREMVEIRHNLNSRRQTLRNEMQQNEEMAAENQKEIKVLVDKYPQYAKEILVLVDKFD